MQMSYDSAEHSSSEQHDVCREAQNAALALLSGACLSTAQLLSAFTQSLGELTASSVRAHVTFPACADSGGSRIVDASAARQLAVAVLLLPAQMAAEFWRGLTGLSSSCSLGQTSIAEDQ